MNSITVVCIIQCKNYVFKEAVQYSSDFYGYLREAAENRRVRVLVCALAVLYADDFTTNFSHQDKVEEFFTEVSALV